MQHIYNEEKRWECVGSVFVSYAPDMSPRTKSFRESSFAHGWRIRAFTSNYRDSRSIRRGPHNASIMVDCDGCISMQIRWKVNWNRNPKNNLCASMIQINCSQCNASPPKWLLICVNFISAMANPISTLTRLKPRSTGNQCTWPKIANRTRAIENDVECEKVRNSSTSNEIDIHLIYIRWKRTGWRKKNRNI